MRRPALIAVAFWVLGAAVAAAQTVTIDGLGNVAAPAPGDEIEIWSQSAGCGIHSCKTTIGALMPLYAPIRVVTSGASDTATATDSTIVWDKSVGSPSAETIPTCVAALAGRVYTVKDGKGDAATDTITIAPVAGSIDGAASYVLATPHAAVKLQCDGISTWQVI
ncbi:MAG TPA: hypothetical protein VMU87_06810 [Stellaceae bacterium]|nr:hypothetical protein [Stellaceae bacterium]